LVWSEVGKGDLTATLASAGYLASSFKPSGSTGTGGAVGRFTPHHFDVAVTPACSGFSYAAQPFSVTVTAKNGLATPTTTVNYDGSSSTAPNFSKAATLSDAPTLGMGSFGSTGAIAATLFVKGVAITATPAYTFTNKTTAAQTLAVRATDADSISSSGYAEGSTPLRSGRLRLSNAFGSEKSALAVPVQAQYWSGNAWVLNSADSCTNVPASAVVRARYYDNHGAVSSAWTSTASAIAITAGNGTLTLGAPSPTTTGSIDLALNLGSSAVDQSCLATHPAGTGAARPWLRAQNGACSTLSDRDPSARASFGIYVPETRKTIHVRELF
jgi:MSHA biogenesis protein MshQ